MPDLSLDGFKKLWNSKEDTERRTFVTDLLKIYDHDWQQLLDDRIDELFSEENAKKLKQRADTTINLLHRAVDELASIYVRGATRTVNGETEGLEAYEAMGMMNMALDQAARLCFCCREILIRPMIDDFGYIVLDVVTPDKFSVIPHPIDPLEVIGVIVKLPTNDKNAVFSIWTEESNYLIDRNWQVIEENDNPYGLIPYQPCHAEYPIRGFWHHKFATGLRDSALWMGVQKTDYNHIRHLQSFKQLAIYGKMEGKDSEMAAYSMDPSRILEVKGGSAKVEVLDMQANLSEHLNTLLEAADAMLYQYGIRQEAIRSSSIEQSGYSLKIKMHKQEQVWDSQRELWRLWENSIYYIARTVMLIDNGIVLPEGDLEIDFPEIGPERSLQEQIDLYNSYLAAGLVSKAWCRRNLGFTKEEIAQIEEELENENQNRVDMEAGNEVVQEPSDSNIGTNGTRSSGQTG